MTTTDRDTLLRSHPVLQLPLSALPVSEEFRNACQALEVATLRQLLERDVSELGTHPQFGYRMLRELVALLETHQLGQLAD